MAPALPSVRGVLAMHSEEWTCDERACDILVVDDERPILDLVGEAFDEAGFGVTLVADLASARAALGRATYDLILADSLAEVGAGFAIDLWPALEAIRAAAGDAQVLIFSAHPERLFEGYRERGFAGFVGKPFDLDELVATVQVAVAAARRARAIPGTLSVLLSAHP